VRLVAEHLAIGLATAVFVVAVSAIVVALVFTVVFLILLIPPQHLYHRGG